MSPRRRRRTYISCSLKWNCCSITHIQEDSKDFIYIAAVLDCCNGEIVGLAMDDNMKKELGVRAFESACRFRDAWCMILHSDRGSQFTGAKFRKTMARYDAVKSIISGHCYDNARMESFLQH